MRRGIDRGCHAAGFAEPLRVVRAEARLKFADRLLIAGRVTQGLRSLWTTLRNASMSSSAPA
jgi:hypothetical protein